jgi:hypothetical protein
MLEKKIHLCPNLLGKNFGQFENFGHFGKTFFSPSKSARIYFFVLLPTI